MSGVGVLGRRFRSWPIAFKITGGNKWMELNFANFYEEGAGCAGCHGVWIVFRNDFATVVYFYWNFASASSREAFTTGRSCGESPSLP